MFTNILDFKIFKEDMKSLMDYVNTFDKVNIVSGNPEILFNGLDDPILTNFFKHKNSVIIPDGVGTVIASKLIGDPVKEKIAGIDLVKEVLIKANKEKKSIYLLGAKEEIINKCVENIKLEFPDLKIAGFHNGFFDINNCNDIVEEISNSNPWAIFVAMGSPRQEIFIEKVMDKTNTHIFMGVGGVFDIFAGELKRAPKWMITLGLEWLYRVAKEPVRIKRLVAIPKFLLLVLKHRKK
ncbi:N-acetylglucosaminyldiphosphoundecaprenol N-acetyl-beta-D-mannosaminyltransferase [Clostridium saccharoperbutylacetonicum]|uniref:N-acetylglucosaminyldiphosphoundecaprenol N-acetyl-beta-D-mannosaminyltransferase n=1 Tax=Clostridium saccharoperbutylacetonicum N1-4(HMT) TaxID=931276 RepID=M1MJ27_9CLOT|nr:WecB/TagA/CpsF family glycosyltransferase [Clostridium saccharoperbutylacetonicum]AGF54846.1 N-acetylmannosaminyltransferase TarA [Clostridium saccharoperbutylacetonicum N1-4(HMT)]NRT64449.1 N-acetylglucosaminyldiphosphoundecaprenol N-acetyl-beta-D-mannosaminyltransferase [Clostridium saccharoperbutylacetonicum]NSB27820.1 N-acetylglucosaminyldiphosphoundecaprenol N-acetyl-beta-D-mannosaminyltransferase [Clostridium saccharoperbutylacetonicum]NSB41305.1 N-acetylglucosaminyldiphosphoundecapren